MIFLGDVAASHFPARDTTAQSYSWPRSELGVANLEGAITTESDLLRRRRVLFNTPGVIDWLKAQGVGVVSLANNHVTDVPGALAETVEACRAAGLVVCGAGSSAHEAAAPALVSDHGRFRVLLAFGWSVIGCKPASDGRPGVNPLEPDHVLASVRDARSLWPEATIIVLAHWNYELEVYPQPAHRQLAFAAIDGGADAVIGCHSHCVQGIEVYNGAPIVYGLGNWFIAQGLFFGGKLQFPDFAALQLAFQWKPEAGEMTCHWFEYDRTDHSLQWKRSEPLVESQKIRDLTPFCEMNHKQYVHWFRGHRRKRKLLPMYRSLNARLGNRVRTEWVGARQRLVDLAFRIGLKGAPR